MILSSTSLATGPLLVAALLLAAAGVAKLRRPAPTGLALAQISLPGSDALVRALGLVEIAAATAAVLVGGAATFGIALLYLGFAAVTTAQVLRARRTGRAADCGCFGDTGAPVDTTHVAVNLLLAATAVWAALAATDGMTGWADAPGTAATLVALAVVGAVGVRALLTDLALVRALVRQDGDR